MRSIFVTGSTCKSGVGRFVVEELCKKNYTIKCLVRSTSKVDWLKKLGVQLINADLDRVESFISSLENVDLVVNIAGMRNALNLIEEMVRTGVKKGIFVNTTGVFSEFKKASTNYQLIEKEMLKIFDNQNINYVIVRPTMIYGNGKDRSITKYIKYLNMHAYYPIFGDGSALIQPVYYKDVSNALLALIENIQCWGKAYNVSGKEPMTYKRFIEIIAEALGRKVTFIYLPLQSFAFGISILEKIIPSFPIKSEQILRTTEDRAFDYTDAQKCFGYNPISFEEGIKLEIEELKRDGYLI